MNKANQVIHHVPQELIKLVVRTNEVDTEETGILVAGVESCEGESKFFFSKGLAEWRGVIAANSLSSIVGSNHLLHQHEWKSIFRSPRSRFVGKSNVCGFFGIKFHTEYDGIILNEQKVSGRKKKV